MVKEIDPRIVRQVQKGNRKNYKKIVDHYQQVVYHVCYLITGDEKEAESLAKDVFLYAYENIHTFAADQRFSLWLYQIAVSLAPQPLLEDKKTICPLVEKYHPLFTSNLTCKERLVLNLKVNQQLSLHEIGEVFGTKTTRISTYMITAREKIRESLATQCYKTIGS